MSGQWQALLLDGSNASGKDVIVTLDDTGMTIKETGGGETHHWPNTVLCNLYQSKDGNRIDLGLNDDRDMRLTITGTDITRYLEPLWEQNPHSNEWAKGARISAALVGFIVMLMVLIWQFDRILPELLPDKYVSAMGKAGVNTVQSIFGQQCRSRDGQRALEKMLARTAGEETFKYKIKLKVVNSSEVNALALPDGHIILFNGLLAKAESPEEVAGVLAHELGHVKHKHPLRGLARGLGLDLVLAMLGAGSVTDISGELISMSFSRKMESEADKASLKMLEQSGISALPLGAFFDRMKIQAPTLEASGSSDKEQSPHTIQETEEDSTSVLAAAITDLLLSAEKYLSTHPLPQDRARIFSEADWSTSTPVLSAQEWQALRAICGDEKTDRDE